VHFGSGSVKRTGLLDKVEAKLKEGGLEFCELGGVVPNPRVSLVRKGIEMIKAEGIDYILSVGGGSVLDSAKAIGYGAFGGAQYAAGRNTGHDGGCQQCADEGFQVLFHKLLQLPFRFSVRIFRTSGQ
jgi:hypothetical protein